jgi:hypothetical protein
MHGENVDSFNVKAGGMYSYHCVSWRNVLVQHTIVYYQ